MNRANIYVVDFNEFYANRSNNEFFEQRGLVWF